VQQQSQVNKAPDNGALDDGPAVAANAAADLDLMEEVETPAELDLRRMAIWCQLFRET
jgi:hypothetical protein